MKTFDPNEIYRMAGSLCDYKFVGYYFESNRPSSYNHIVIGDDDQPCAFMNASHINATFDRNYTHPMLIVVPPKKYKVAYQSPHGWMISENSYATLEDFYETIKPSNSPAHLLVEKE